MRAVDTVEFLRGYQRAVREWRRLCDEADRMRALGVRVSKAFGGIPADAGGHSKIEAALEGVENVLEQADAAKVDVETRRGEVCAAIDRLPDERHRLVLRLRYLNGYSWRLVAEHSGYEERHARRLHREAVAWLDANPAKEAGKDAL